MGRAIIMYTHGVRRRQQARTHAHATVRATRSNPINSMIAMVSAGARTQTHIKSVKIALELSRRGAEHQRALFANLFNRPEPGAGVVVHTQRRERR